jgi:3-isopropylmalate/(R)-2-methylmalate dehydratase large subunit
MGQTIYEKILSRTSSTKAFKTGDIIWVRPDLIACTDFNTRGKPEQLRQVGLQRLPKPEKLVVVVDHAPEQALAPENSEMEKTMRDWVKKEKVSNFYDTGRGGFMCQIIAEKGHVRPGMMVLTGDPEGEACGALGAFVIGGEDILMPLAIDELWLEVPEVVKCIIKGKFDRGVLSIDLRYKLLGDFGEEFGKFIEFQGPAITDMSIDQRMNICSSLYLIGSNGIIAADQKTIDYVRNRTHAPFEVVRSDADAKYADVFEYDVSRMGPQVVFPPSTSNTKTVVEAEGIDIDQAFIGGCTNGRLDDLRIAADILKGRKLHSRVRMFVTPISQEVYLIALKEGLISIFVDAGIVVTIPSCGVCPGHIGRLASGEACISTSTVNTPGRMGSTEAKIYLASPATVAASAIEGKIVDPRNYLLG